MATGSKSQLRTLDDGAGASTIPASSELKAGSGWPQPFWRSLSARLTAMAFIWMVLFLVGGGFLFSRLFTDYLTQTLDASLEQNMQAKIGAAQIGADGQVRFLRMLGEQRFIEPYSGFYWQVSQADEPPIRSRSLWDEVLKVDLTQNLFSARFSFRNGPENQYLRVLERDVYLPGDAQPYRFIVTGNYADVSEPLRNFHTSLFWGLGLLAVGLAASMVLQVRYGLRPLRRLRRSVMQIRTGQVGRVPDDLPPEVMPLVREMNGLLAENEHAVDRAKTQAGNLAHALKTPLSILTNEAAQKDTELAGTVQRQANLMQRHIDHNLARARAASHYGRAHVQCDGVAAVQAIGRVVAKLHRDRQVDVVAPGNAIMVQMASQDLEEILGNVVENAAKFSQTRVRVEIARAPGSDDVFFTIEDDGPGIPAKDTQAIFARGRRLDESVPGSGLGLSIVADLLDIYDGAIILGRSDSLGGLKAVMTLHAGRCQAR